MEIELYSKLQNPIEAIQQLGRVFAKSGMFGCEREEQGQVLAMICLAERKSPVQITTNYDIVEGKLRKKALAALADFRSAGGKHTWLKSGDDVAANDADRYAELELVDKEGKKNVYRYSMADAKAEGLVRDKSRWVKRPGNMLRARCISNGLAMLCPEIFAGEDDSEAPETEPKPLLRETAPRVETPTPKPEAKSEPVIDVPATVVAKPEGELKSEPVADGAVDLNKVDADPTTNRLNAYGESALVKLFDKNVDKAFAWLKAQGWIKEKLSDISANHARRLLSKPSEVTKTLEAYKPQAS